MGGGGVAQQRPGLRCSPSTPPPRRRVEGLITVQTVEGTKELDLAGPGRGRPKGILPGGGLVLPTLPPHWAGVEKARSPVPSWEGRREAPPEPLQRGRPGPPAAQELAGARVLVSLNRFERKKNVELAIRTLAILWGKGLRGVWPRPRHPSLWVGRTYRGEPSG